MLGKKEKLTQLLQKKKALEPREGDSEEEAPQPQPQSRKDSASQRKLSKENQDQRSRSNSLRKVSEAERKVSVDHHAQAQEEEDDQPEDKQVGMVSLDRTFFSDKKFSDIEFCEPTQRAIREKLKFEYMTHIQAKSIPLLLKGKDLLGSAKTGSGKTLAFLLPALEVLHRVKFTQQKGTGVIIITPTRELAQQIYDVGLDLLTFHNKTIALLIGGQKRKDDAVKLAKGATVIVATPGRLLDHLQNTKFTFHNLMCLIIDEADQILKVGFEDEMRQILNILPTERQTVLFSATQTKKVDDLVRLSLKEPVFVGVDEAAETSTVSGLEQGFVICEAEKRFRLLFTFLKKNRKKKIMVFFSSCNAVKFYSDLFNFVDVAVKDIHGKQKQQKRLNTFYEFCNADSGTLFCTDVAARGLDIPKVDWIVQYDPPDDVKEYIHRVGRTCRGAGATGRALLFLLPTELNYLRYLREARVQLNEYEFPTEKLSDIQEQFEKLVAKNYFLHRCSREAYASYLHAYASHSLKDVFDVNQLDLQKVAVSFGLHAPPRVNLNVKLSGNTVRKNKVRSFLAGQKVVHTGILTSRKPGETRQFSR